MLHSKKPSLDLKIDTALDDTPDEVVVEAVNGDTEEMEVDPDEANDVEKSADLEAEEEEADEKKYLSKTKMHNLSKTLAKETMSPLILKGRVMVTRTRNKTLRPTRSKTKTMITIMRKRKNLCPKEISKTKKSNFSLHIERKHRMFLPRSSSSSLCYESGCMLRKWSSWLGRRRWFKPVGFLCVSCLRIYFFSCPPENAVFAKGDDQAEGQTTWKRSYESPMQRNVAKLTKMVSGAGGRYLFLLTCIVYLSYLQLTADELQTDMIAETNRKRRKLERERRCRSFN
jgi:hypothetical protein